MTCEPGVVYSVSAKGAVREVRGGIDSELVKAAGFSSFNGLGVGEGGLSAYGYERTNNAGTATIYSLNRSSGLWESTNASTGSSATGYQFVGGAVDLSTGLYYFGGFSGDGKNFGIYVYDPSIKKISRKGVISTDRDIVRGELANGDMAFDSNGTLFVVRGMSNQTSIFSVTKDNLNSASGSSTVAASYSGPYRTTTDVNGVAFDADGYGYLGAGAKFSQWDTPAWTSADSNWFSGGSNFGSTDLATCAAPPTITLQKDIVGGRAKASDQFTLSLKNNGDEITPVTTTGNAKEVQKEKIGPVPTKRGIKLTFAETAGNSSTNLDDYASAYSCTVGEEPISGASGTGPSGTVTIPNTGNAVICTITNSPLTANVSIHKDVADEDGKNVKPGKDWSVKAKATATTDGLTQAPTATSQKTNAGGDAKWGLKFNKATGRATVAVSETQQDGFEFASGSCLITPLDGTKVTKKLSGESATDLTGIRPGDAVDCTYLNKVKATSLTLVKKVDNKEAAGTAKETDWTLKAAGDKTIAGKTGTKDVTDVKVKAGDYKLSESGGPDGYEASDWDCGPKKTVTADSVTLTAGDDVTCTITNTAKTGTVTWKKTDDSGSALKGSVWTMTGPDGTAVEVEDCTAASASACTGPDKDPADGQFAINGLRWGDYTLVEKSAPAGYTLDDTEHTFTVSGSTLKQSIGSFTNEQKPPVALPLTGGTGSQIFIIAGAALCAAGAVGALIKGLRRRNRKH